MINFPVAAPASFALAGGVVLLAVFFYGSHGHEKLLGWQLNQILTTSPLPGSPKMSVGTTPMGSLESLLRLPGCRVARRAGLVISTRIVYPGSGREDA